MSTHLLKCLQLMHKHSHAIIHEKHCYTWRRNRHGMEEISSLLAFCAVHSKRASEADLSLLLAWPSSWRKNWVASDLWSHVHVMSSATMILTMQDIPVFVFNEGSIFLTSCAILASRNDNNTHYFICPETEFSMATVKNKVNYDHFFWSDTDSSSVAVNNECSLRFEADHHLPIGHQGSLTSHQGLQGHTIGLTCLW